MQKRGKLELTWVGKYDEKKIEPRILVEDKSKSYGDPNSENMLIHGDNLIALQALQQDYAGKVKCIYIDPPYNVDATGVPYDDNIEHSTWLSIMYQRIKELHSLLSDDGVIYISINYEEMFHLKLICDEIFGARNFCNIISIRTATTASFRAINECPVNVSEFILVFAKDKSQAVFTPQYIEVNYSEDYGNIIENFDQPIDQWVMRKLDDVIYEEAGVADKKEYQAKYGELWKELRYRKKAAKAFSNASSVCSLNTMQKPSQKVQAVINESKNNKGKFYVIEREGKDPIIIFNGRTLAFYQKKIRKVEGQFVPTDILTNVWTDISYLSLGLEGGVDFPNSKKPEKLIERILLLSTNPGDIVLDSFLGSGTTAAVAHKMGRKYIGVEMGDHCYTHCKVRLDNVINGEQGGISKAVDWQGGGGYHFYELAPSLLVKNDKIPVYQINPEYTFEMLCEAICKIEGFRYKPDGIYHGHSSEKRFIHITKEFVNAEYVISVAATLGEGQSLLIYGTKTQSDLVLPDNIEVKKIPKDLLEKCDFESEVR